MGRKRKKKPQEPKLVKIEEACRRYSLGRNTMRKVAKESGSVVRVGKRYMINITELDIYLDSLCDYV